MMKIASLGSSFAAGPGIKPIVNRSAMRSGSNYANLVAQCLEADLTDLSISGATLLTIWNEPQVLFGQKFEPQLNGLPEDIDIVFILGGGNDIQYIGGMIFDSIESYWFGRMVMSMKNSLFQDLSTPNDIPDEEVLSERYGVVLDAIHTKAPKAKVLVLEYLTILGPDVKPGVDVPFDAVCVEKYRNIASKLQRATSTAINGRQKWCQRVPVAELSEQHGLGSNEPWVWGFGLKAILGGAIYHPNEVGMKAVADMILKTMN